MNGNTGRATVPEQIFSLWRPVVVLGVVPALAVWHFGWSFGLGTGWQVPASRAAGLVLAGLWAWWFWWAEGTFMRRGISLNPNWRRPLHPRRRWTWKPPTGGTLITSGPYRYSTAPMIFGVFCGLWAEGFLLSPWVFIWAAVFTSGMTTWIMVRERPELRRRFGQQAADWQDTTPFLIPYTWLAHAAVVALYWPLRLWQWHEEHIERQVHREIDAEVERQVKPMRAKVEAERRRAGDTDAGRPA